MVTAVLLLSLVVLLVSGLPVGFAMAISGAIGLYLVGGPQTFFGILEHAPLSTISRYELLSMPMFILMAQFIVSSRIAEDLFDALVIWLGRTRGGLAIATALFGAGFSAVSGSSVAGAVTLASTSAPAMFKQGYERQFANGVVGISGTLGMLIPPSIALILYSLIADLSTVRVQIAGAIPGVLVTLLIIATIYYLIWRDPSRAPHGRAYPMREKVAALWLAGPLVALMIMVGIFLYSGLATIVETSALGAGAAFLLVLFSRRLTLRVFWRAVSTAARASAWIGMILIGAEIFGYAMTLTQTTQMIVHAIAGLPLNRYVIMALIILLLLVLGTFLEGAAMLVLTVPILVPIVVTLGFDPIWFGVIFVLAAEVGQLSPPVGIVIFVIAKYTNQRAEDVFKGVWPHIVAHILIIALFVAFPDLIVWLPNYLYG